MRVFRVQRDNGDGPFITTGPTVLARAIGDPYHYDRLPEPWNDGIDSPDTCHFCGVASLRDLVLWFPRRARRALHERAYRLFEFEVADDAVLSGGLQVMFDPSEADLVATYPLAVM